MSLCYLGVDTSNYTTSVALADEGGIIENIRMVLDVGEGKRGLRQSDALFSHTVNLPKAFEKLRHRGNIAAVGVSAYPRDVEGSYMPCFLAGISAASAVASALDVPLYKFSHQAGHISAALYSCGREDLRRKEFIAFHVSGGTTEVLHVCDGKIDLVGSTLDISAGKAIDRVGVRLGLKFPCGAELEKLCSDDIPHDMKVCVNGCDCNLSGLENKASDMISSGAKPGDVCAFVIGFVTKTIDKMTRNALALYPGLPVVYAGGVMSNKYIQKAMRERFDSFFASPEFSCDNASGIALLTRNSAEENNARIHA